MAWFASRAFVLPMADGVELRLWEPVCVRPLLEVFTPDLASYDSLIVEVAS